MFVLVGAMALIADRYVIRSPTGTIVVATHPVFVLGMVALGPVPMLLIGQAVIFANRPKKARCSWATRPCTPSSSLPGRCWPDSCATA